MLNLFIEGLQDGLNDEHRTAFRTMFVTKRDVATAIALAQFYMKTKELLEYKLGQVSVAIGVDELLPSSDPHTDALVSELAKLEAKLP